MFRYNTLFEVIKSYSACHSKGIHFILGEADGKRLSYAELYHKALVILNELHSRGLRKGSQLILYFTDNEMFVLTFWACIAGGIIPVPVSVGTTGEHKAKVFRIWEVLDEPYLITDEKTAGSLREYAMTEDGGETIKDIVNKYILFHSIKETGYAPVNEGNPEDVALIQFSSGSTGDPKGVVLTHGNLLTNIRAIIKGSALTSSDISLSWMPLTHDMGLIGKHLTTTFLGINQYLMPPSLFISKPLLWMRKASQHKATLLSSPNFGYKYFLSKFKPTDEHVMDLSSVRVICNGAEPISVDLCDRFLDTLAPFGLKRSVMFNVYGMAEASLAVTFPPVETEFSYAVIDSSQVSLGNKVVEIEDRYKPSAVTFADVGFPVENCQVRICDDHDRQLGEGFIGHIQIKGSNVTRGYYNNKEATEKSFTADSWLRTGDIGFMRNNRLFVTGRAKEVIIVNGQNYYPHDLERVVSGIKECPFKEVAVCGMQSQKEKTDYIVVFALYKKKIQEFIHYVSKIREQLNLTYGLEIRAVVPVKKIPKTTSGKIQRYKLGEKYKNGEFDSLVAEIERLSKAALADRPSECPQTTTERKLLQLCQEIFDNDEIGLRDNLIDCGGNSLNLIRMYEKLEELFPGKVCVTSILANPTVSGLARYLDGEQHGSAAQ